MIVFFKIWNLLEVFEQSYQPYILTKSMENSVTVQKSMNKIFGVIYIFN